MEVKKFRLCRIPCFCSFPHNCYPWDLCLFHELCRADTGHQLPRIVSWVRAFFVIMIMWAWAGHVLLVLSCSCFLCCLCSHHTYLSALCQPWVLGVFQVCACQPPQLTARLRVAEKIVLLRFVPLLSASKVPEDESLDTSFYCRVRH